MRRKRRITLFLVPMLAIAAAVFLRIRLQPLVEQLAATQMDSVISTLMNNAIDELIAQEQIHYDRMILLEKDVDGKITALQTNMSEVNRLKTRILQLINQHLSLLQKERIGIPLGSIILPELFSGRGPELPIRLLSVTTSGADFQNQFSAAGINQTLHRILLTANVDVSVLIPGGVTNLRVSTQVVVAETIVVGMVPENYLTFDQKAEAKTP